MWKEEIFQRKREKRGRGRRDITEINGTFPFSER